MISCRTIFMNLGLCSLLTIFAQSRCTINHLRSYVTNFLIFILFRTRNHSSRLKATNSTKT
uniref:Uncharacterized protein n=1 Tax=Osmundaria fimbriata TaxID=228265 RepID=A0A1Z1M4Z0_OSMFI|nr:hypothetical protein [Osmundaria fimbriata]ARW60911.1 hypothetical protein [Osmundaria fimbriata]